MLNNKGFAVSAVLYTLLIAFLLFLGVALASLASSSGLVGNSNNDIIDGTNFEVMQVKLNGCTEESWNRSNVILRIKSRYGTKYWPKDFSDNKTSGNIEVTCNGGVCTVPVSEGMNVTVKDKVNGSEQTVILFNICK